METLGARLRQLIEADGRVDAVLEALMERAQAGDLKAIQMVLDLLGENPREQPDEPPVLRVEFAPGMEDLAQ